MPEKPYEIEMQGTEVADATAGYLYKIPGAISIQYTYTVEPGKPLKGLEKILESMHRLHVKAQNEVQRLGFVAHFPGHYGYVVIDLKSQEVVIGEPFGAGYENYLSTIEAAIKEVYPDFTYVKKPIKIQTDHYSCGRIASKMTEYLCMAPHTPNSLSDAMDASKIQKHFNIQETKLLATEEQKITLDNEVKAKIEVAKIANKELNIRVKTWLQKEFNFAEGSAELNSATLRLTSAITGNKLYNAFYAMLEDDSPTMKGKIDQFKTIVHPYLTDPKNIVPEEKNLENKWIENALIQLLTTMPFLAPVLEGHTPDPKVKVGDLVEVESYELVEESESAKTSKPTTAAPSVEKSKPKAPAEQPKLTSTTPTEKPAPKTPATSSEKPKPPPIPPKPGKIFEPPKPAAPAGKPKPSIPPKPAHISVTDPTPPKPTTFSKPTTVSTLHTSEISTAPEKTKPYTTSRPSNLLHDDNKTFQTVRSYLEREGWRVDNLAKGAFRQVSKDTKSFKIYTNKLSTQCGENKDDKEVFKTMLNVFRQMHGEKTLPKITAPNENIKNLWLAALKETYGEKHDFSKTVEVKNAAAPKPEPAPETSKPGLSK